MADSTFSPDQKTVFFRYPAFSAAGSTLSVQRTGAEKAAGRAGAYEEKVPAGADDKESQTGNPLYPEVSEREQEHFLADDDCGCSDYGCCRFLGNSCCNPERHHLCHQHGDRRSSGRRLRVDKRYSDASRYAALYCLSCHYRAERGDGDRNNCQKGRSKKEAG